MKILVIGGTGTMGKPLVELLFKNNDLSVVCRKKREELQGVCYKYGDAKDRFFMSQVLKERFDTIVDFCFYSSEEFPLYFESMLKATDQYVCLSSAQVYADVSGLKTENSPRFMETDPPRKGAGGNFWYYCYEKARIEDTLTNSGYINWTIIRPGITMNEDHYMWSDYRDEEWTYRIFRGKSVIIPQNMLNIKTSIAYGGDVARMIMAVIGNHEALGQVYNVTTYIYTWGELLDKYKIIFNRLGYPIKIKYIKSHEQLVKKSYRTSYYERTRCIDRSFDSTKIYELMIKAHIDKKFADIDTLLEEWVRRDFRRVPLTIKKDQIESVARLDRLSGELSKRYLFGSNKDYIKYYICRYFFELYYFLKYIKMHIL